MPSAEKRKMISKTSSQNFFVRSGQYKKQSARRTGKSEEKRKAKTSREKWGKTASVGHNSLLMQHKR